MAANQADKYRQFFTISTAGAVGESTGDVAREKLIKVITNGLDISTVVHIEAKLRKAVNWDQIGSVSSSEPDGIFDISMYDVIRYNVFTYGGTPATLEVTSAVSSEQAVTTKDKNGLDAYRVIDTVPPEGDDKTAYLNALLTLNFWDKTGVDISLIDFVTTQDEEPVLDSAGNFIEV